MPPELPPSPPTGLALIGAVDGSPVSVVLCAALALLWILAVNWVAWRLGPPARQRAIWLLIVVGVPLVGLLTWRLGPLIGSLVMVAGVCFLAWPPVLWFSRDLRPAAAGGKRPEDPAA